MIRCAWCGARNYAIDSWCSACKQHLDWEPPAGRRRRWPAALALLAAVGGVALALALPAASWLTASSQTPPTLPTTALAPVTPATSPAPSSAPTAEPNSTSDAPPVDSTPTTEPTPAPTPAPDQVVPEQAATPDAGDPAAVVRAFYQAVAAHQFDLAAALWTPGLQAQDPPPQFIDQRFAETQQLDLAAEHVVGEGGGVAIVYVDVVEISGGETRHWIGTWQLVDTPSGWLLNRPNLRSAA